MSIPFESSEVQLQKLRERLRSMTDTELVKFGKAVRGLSEPRVGVIPDPWKEQLQEARAEWRRRHPKAEARSDWQHLRTIYCRVRAELEWRPSSGSQPTYASPYGGGLYVGGCFLLLGRDLQESHLPHSAQLYLSA